MARGEEVGLDDVPHVTGSLGPGANLVEVGGGVIALGEVDAGEKRVEGREFVVPVVCARCLEAVIAEGTGGGEVAEIQEVAGALGRVQRREGSPL
jgi:hypothetical protein